MKKYSSLHFNRMMCRNDWINLRIFIWWVLSDPTFRLTLRLRYCFCLLSLRWMSILNNIGVSNIKLIPDHFNVISMYLHAVLHIFCIFHLLCEMNVILFITTFISHKRWKMQKMCKTACKYIDITLKWSGINLILETPMLFKMDIHLRLKRQNSISISMSI